MEWEKSLGGSGLDTAFSVQETPDGGYIAAGRSDSNDGDAAGNHGEGDIWTVRLASDGTLKWQKSLGGSGEDGASSVLALPDGGYLLAGYSDSADGDAGGSHGEQDFWVLRLNAEDSERLKAPDAEP